MTPHQAARHYAASLLEQALAACHNEVELARFTTDGHGRPAVLSAKLHLDTFEEAPPFVKRAIEQNRLDGDAVVEEMAKLAEELRRESPPELHHEDWCDLVRYNECCCGAAEAG